MVFSPEQLWARVPVAVPKRFNRFQACIPMSVGYWVMFSMGFTEDLVIMGEVIEFEWLAWEIIGFLGVALFGSRWLIQIHSSRKAGKPVLTRWFWWMSLAGSALLIAYFGFSPKRGAVGIFNNLFPAAIAIYNLALEFRAPRRIHRHSNLGPGTPAGSTVSSTSTSSHILQSKPKEEESHEVNA